MDLFCIRNMFLQLQVDPETAADATVIDYVTDDPSLLPEQPGKPPPP